jgi:hypothetical protein
MRKTDGMADASTSAATGFASTSLTIMVDCMPVKSGEFLEIS